MIKDVLPPGACAAECFGDLTPDVVLPAEFAVVRTAAAARRREFHTVRALARRAMAQLAPEAPRQHEGHSLVPDALGAPAWPPGIVGSMTHSRSYRAAVVAQSSTYAAIGLDAESNRELPPEVCEIVCRPEERSMIAALARQEPSLPWSCVVFSAKESVYKAWYPLTRGWLDFDEVSVQLEHVSQTFHAYLHGDIRASQASRVIELAGRWATTADFIFTTAYLSSRSRSR